MATLIKPTKPCPLPLGTEIVARDGKPHVRLRENGKAVFYPLTKDGMKFLRPAAKWYGKYRDADGVVRLVPLSPSKDAARLMLSDLLKKVEGEKSGVIDTYTKHRKRPLPELLTEYEQHVLDKGATAKEAAQAARRCEIVFAAVGFVLFKDLDATAAEHWLAERRRLPKADGGFGPATSNHYRKSLVAFGNWLVKARRTPENPFRHIPKVNTEVDIRHQRRPLIADEYARLIDAARSGDAFRGLLGADRAFLYVIAGMTGLRASELASLSPESFHLDAETPIVVVEAAYSKHRRRDEVPLHLDLVSELRPWLNSKTIGTPLWPGNWAKHTAAVDLIKCDLEVAREAWVGEAKTLEEKKKRDMSDFLVYRDREGRVADFHSLRHRFVTELVRAGVAPKDAKELARHSTITLTMDRYSHVELHDTAAALARLKMPAGTGSNSEPTVLRLTGTDGGCVSDVPGDVPEGGDRRGKSRTNEETCTLSPWKGESLEYLKIWRLRRIESKREKYARQELNL